MTNTKRHMYVATLLACRTKAAHYASLRTMHAVNGHRNLMMFCHNQTLTHDGWARLALDNLTGRGF